MIFKSHQEARTRHRSGRVMVLSGVSVFSISSSILYMEFDFRGGIIMELSLSWLLSLYGSNNRELRSLPFSPYLLFLTYNSNVTTTMHKTVAVMGSRKKEGISTVIATICGSWLLHCFPFSCSLMWTFQAKGTVGQQHNKRNFQVPLPLCHLQGVTPGFFKSGTGQQ